MPYFIKLYKEQGLCVRCGIRPAREGKKSCKTCSDKQKRIRAEKSGKIVKPNHSISDIVKYASEHGISYGQAALIIDKEDKERCVN